MAVIDRFFEAMLEKGASDLLLLQGQPPKIREHGHVVALSGEPPLDGETLEPILQEICPEMRWRKYRDDGDIDFAYSMGPAARFRANYYRQITGHGAVFRIIPTKILTLAELKCPPLITKLVELEMGLVLVTGPTGSGKSTTLAAMLNHMNETRGLKIVTLEDPIEFVHPNKKSVFVQREVGDHTASFASGLKAALREDVNCILVGEMRDLETIALAISAAENGVLVFGTLHTNCAAKTIDRIVNVFPAEQQTQILSMLSTSLRAVISQQLLRKADGSGRVAVRELLLNNAAASAAIREGQIAKLNQVIQTGMREGMVALDEALLALVKSGVVTGEDAYLKALDKKTFEQALEAKDSK
jgi:twitching motility protein PilT